MSLQWIGQQDFAAGIVRGVARDQQLGLGVDGALNVLLDDDGDAYRRGAVGRITAAPAPAPLTFIWSGYLSVHYRTLVATASRFYALDGAAFVDLGPPGLTYPALPAIVGDVIYLPGFAWGGATKAAYSTGTASSDNSKTITGVGTSWLANVEPGMFYTRTGWGSRRIASVNSNTQLTLDRPYPASGAAAYTISAVAITSAAALTNAQHVGTIADRLVVAVDNRISFSVAGDAYEFLSDDYHLLPDGVDVMALTTIRDQLLVFTNYGLWSIAGMAFDLTDEFGNVQHNLSRLTPELSLWHEAGITDWAGAIVAPCIDRVYLVDGLSQPLPISDSIAPLYMSHVRAGYKPGGAKAFRNHLFLPIIDPAGTVRDVLVCRVNRPVRGRQLYYPWSQLGGYGANARAFDVELRAAPRLQAAHGDGHVTNYTDIFAPTVGAQIDADGNAPVFDLMTRDFPTGNGQPCHIRKLRVEYSADGEGELQVGYSAGAESQTYQDVIDSGRTYAQVLADYPNYDSLARGFATDPASVEWSEPGSDRYWQLLAPQSIEPPGVEPLDWSLPAARRVRYVRARIRVTDPLVSITVHKLLLARRPTPHER